LAKVDYCQECQVGIAKSSTATYYTWIDEDLVMVPNFPCWVCDVCGKREWDSQSLMNLNLLLSPNAGQESGRKRTRSGKPDAERPLKTHRRAIK
jgi:YgiT-type zinc finger domain-containing protein